MNPRTERIARILWPIPARRAVALCMIVLGLGRLGVLSVGTPTTFPAYGYGLLYLALAVGLLMTQRGESVGWFGRTMAALSAGLLAGMAWDVGHIVGTLWNTSSALLGVLALIMFFEACTPYDC